MPQPEVPAAEGARRATGGPAVPLAEIAAALGEAEHIIVASHENPDGDAIGCVRAMELALRSLGKDVIAYIPAGKFPHEYDFIRPDTLVREVPADAAGRVLLALDCGNASRLASDDLPALCPLVLNVDHHADNTHFGDLNTVRGKAACAAELVYELCGLLGVDVTREIATAIYVGMVTDTGRFQYSNTTVETLELAATLMRVGVDVHDVFQRVYESMAFHTLKLLGRGLAAAERWDDGRIVSTYLTRVDFEAAGADDSSAESLVEMLRSVEGAEVALMVRDLDGDTRAQRKGSLRTKLEWIDVSVIARSYGGGGHRQAAGFSTDEPMEAIVERVVQMVREQRAAGRQG